MYDKLQNKSKSNNNKNNNKKKNNKTNNMRFLLTVLGAKL